MMKAMRLAQVEEEKLAALKKSQRTTFKKGTSYPANSGGSTRVAVSRKAN